MMTTYAVIGASRGIGLEYIRQLAARPNTTVFAVVRNACTSTHLNAVVESTKNVHVLEGDVADYISLKRAAEQVSVLSGGSLDCLIHNAARMGNVQTMGKSFDDFDDMEELDADFIDAFKINALGVVHGISAFLPLLRASTASLKKIVVISTPTADYQTVLMAGKADMVAYSMTKSAGLMATTKWALKLKAERFVVVSLNPGMVDTTGTRGESGDPADQATLRSIAEEYVNMGWPVVLETAAESVAHQLKVVDTLRPSDNGLLLNHRERALQT
ncbi:NAD-P-binding protein [Daedaleopsis nitida]|nr:NAD-P-binding protein [Daedaleopsis nitida]